MTLYSLLKEISSIITPEDDSFYTYALYTSDDNGGFLRTRYCWCENKPIKDGEIGDGFENVLVTSKNEINTKDFCKKPETLVKLQITYSLTNATISDADWDTQLGYCYVYIFDLNARKYTMNYIENPCSWYTEYVRAS